MNEYISEVLKFIPFSHSINYSVLSELTKRWMPRMEQDDLDKILAMLLQEGQIFEPSLHSYRRISSESSQVAQTVKQKELKKMAINWSEFEAGELRYVKLVAGKPKTMKFSDVEQGTTDIPKQDDPDAYRTIPCLKFTVVEEDRNPVEKEWSVTSKRLAMELKPFIEDGRITTKIFKITQFGTRFDTTYEVKVVG